MKLQFRLQLKQERPLPQDLCWICINKDPPVKTKSTKQGYYSNLVQEFYYCDECEGAYIAMRKRNDPTQYTDYKMPQEKK